MRAARVVGYHNGGWVEVKLLAMIDRALTVVRNQIGSYTGLVEPMEPARQGKARIESQTFPLDSIADAGVSLHA